MTDDVDTAERWKRFTNPKTLADFTDHFTRDDLMKFPEGRAIVAEIDSIRNDPMRAEYREMGRRAAEMIERIALDALKS